MKMKIPKDLRTLDKDELVQLAEYLIAKLDNYEVEEERERDLSARKSCHCAGCAKPSCAGCECHPDGHKKSPCGGGKCK
ncbi:MAG: hypothetical protein M1549_01625 [Candidatus Dependentiae bacterium]|nr:hypothetical protein [Candidatus Dependentiae bacterium]